MSGRDIDFKIGADLKQFRSAMGNIDSSLRQLSGGFAALGGVIGASFAVDAIRQFASEAIDLAAQAEGVRNAFDRLNEPTLLNDLRKATKGTVNDLELMKAAVKANNFNIPLEQLGKLLGFAQQRATETGESVDYMVESIVTGIARKSLPILDNLGFSAVEVREEFNATGDMAAAVGNIIERQMGNATNSTMTLSEQISAQKASIDNLKMAVGEQLAPVYKSFLDSAMKGLQDLNFFLSQHLSGWEKAALVMSYTMGAQGIAMREQIRATGMANMEIERHRQEQEKNSEEVERSLPVLEAQEEALDGITEAMKRQDTALESLTKKTALHSAQAAQLNTYLPGLQDMGVAAFDAFVAFDELSNTIGNTLTSAFDAALINGESFFSVFINGLKQLLAQIAATIAAALVLSAILVVATGGLGGLSMQSIGTAFKHFGGPAMGVPSFGINGGLGGLMQSGGVELFSRISGSDLILATERASRNRSRQIGG